MSCELSEYFHIFDELRFSPSKQLDNKLLCTGLNRGGRHPVTSRFWVELTWFSPLPHSIVSTQYCGRGLSCGECGGGDRCPEDLGRVRVCIPLHGNQ